MRDVNRPTQVFSAIADVGEFPRASVLAPNERLFVQGSLSRDVLVYDLTALLTTSTARRRPRWPRSPPSPSEKLPPQILAGKKIFHDASDIRMDDEGYISCGSCHFEGIDDGRVYDFSTRGEGLRNTIALAGPERERQQGRLNWTGTLDEVQDFEHQIRELFGGQGFHAGRRVSRRHARSTARRSEGGAEPRAGRAGGVRRLARSRQPEPLSQPGRVADRRTASRARRCSRSWAATSATAGRTSPTAPRGLLHDVGTITAAVRHARGRTAVRLRHADVARASGRRRRTFTTAPRRRCATSSPRGTRTTCTGTSARCRRTRSISWSPTWSRSTTSCRCSACRSIRLRRRAAAAAGTALGGPIAGGCACELAATGAGARTGHRRRCSSSSGALVQREAAAARSSPTAAGGMVGVRPAGGAAGRMSRRPPGRFAAADRLVDAAGGDRGGSGARAARLRARTPTTGCARATAATASPRFSAAAAGAPRSATSPSCFELVGLADQRAFALTGNSTSLLANRVSAINPRLLVFPRVGDDLRPPRRDDGGRVRARRAVRRGGEPRSVDRRLQLLPADLRADSATTRAAAAISRASSPRRSSTTGPRTACTTRTISKGRPSTAIPAISRTATARSESSACRSSRARGCTGSRSASCSERTPIACCSRSSPTRTRATSNTAASRSRRSRTRSTRAAGRSSRRWCARKASATQPNPFDAQIVTEMKSGSSPTWEARFETHLQGLAIAVPYPAIDVTDEAKRNAATRSYQDVVRRRVAAREACSTSATIFSDDAQAEAELRSRSPAPTGRPSSCRCARAATTDEAILS